MLCCETWSCYTHRHNDLEGHSNFSRTIYSFSVLCLEPLYCGGQQWRLFTEKFYIRQVALFTSGGLSRYFGLGLGHVSGLGLVLVTLVLVLVFISPVKRRCFGNVPCSFTF